MLKLSELFLYFYILQENLLERSRSIYSRSKIKKNRILSLLNTK